jgi:hypothetical protein
MLETGMDFLALFSGAGRRRLTTSSGKARRAPPMGLQNEGASAEQDVMDQEQERPTDGDAELESTKELLDRTVRFLAQCMEDPTAAMASEDPRTIQIRHRRSA